MASEIVSAVPVRCRMLLAPDDSAIALMRSNCSLNCAVVSGMPGVIARNTVMLAS